MQSWIKGAIGFIGFFGIIIGYVLQAPHLSGCLDLAGLIKTGLLAGAVVGGIIGFILQRNGKDQDARFSIYAGMLVLGVATGPLVLSIINRAFSSAVHPVEFELLSVKPVMGSRGGIIKGETFRADAHLIEMKKEETTYTVKIGSDLNNYILDDDSIILNVKRGGLRFDYIDHSPTTHTL